MQDVFTGITDSVDYTAMYRPQIAEEITAAVGEGEITEEVLEDLVLKLEERDAVDADEFWALVEEAFDAAEADYDSHDMEAGIIDIDDAPAPIGADGSRLDIGALVLHTGGRYGTVIESETVYGHGAMWDEVLVRTATGRAWFPADELTRF